MNQTTADFSKPKNLPVLYHNILSSLPNGLAQEAFLWATDRTPPSDPMLYSAEKFAREVHQLENTLTVLLEMGAEVHGLESYDPDLLNFILKRHANWRFGGNQTVGYLR